MKTSSSPQLKTMPEEVVEVIDELIDALAKFGARVGRRIELLIDDAGLLTVTTAEEGDEAFEQVASFGDVAALWQYLQMGEL